MNTNNIVDASIYSILVWPWDFQVYSKMSTVGLQELLDDAVAKQWRAEQNRMGVMTRIRCVCRWRQEQFRQIVSDFPKEWARCITACQAHIIFVLFMLNGCRVACAYEYLCELRRKKKWKRIGKHWPLTDLRARWNAETFSTKARFLDADDRVYGGRYRKAAQYFDDWILKEHVQHLNYHSGIAPCNRLLLIQTANLAQPLFYQRREEVRMGRRWTQWTARWRKRLRGHRGKLRTVDQETPESLRNKALEMHHCMLFILWFF